MYGIIGLLSVAAFVFFCAFYYEKKTKVSQLNYRNLSVLRKNMDKLQDAYERLPSEFLPLPLKRFLAEGILEISEHISQISRNSVEEKRAFDNKKEQLDNLNQGISLREDISGKADPGEEVRFYLRIIRSFVIDSVKTKRLSPARAAGFLTQIDNFFAQNIIQFYSNLGFKAYKNNDPYRAAYYYNLAVRRLSERNKHGRYNKKISELNGVISEMESIAQSRERTVEGSSLSNALEEEMERLEKELMRVNYDD